MTLKLLLGLLFIVWRSTSAEEYTNHWRATEDVANAEFCSHDGFKTEACKCNVDYTGNFCLNRKCRNFGYNGQGFPTGAKVDRCICPPGFLGRNCEPVSCVPGNNQVYTSSKNEKSISILVSYNSKMAETWGTNTDIGQLICNKENYTRSFNYNYENANYNAKSDETKEKCFSNVGNYLSVDTCLDDDNKPIPCTQLDIANLDSLVQNSPPNSIVFVLTNMGLVSTPDSVAENIIATSIARRIQINVLVYNNTGFLATDPGLAYLNKIATATFGTFVLPSIKSSNEQYNVVDSLLNNWDQGNQVSLVLSDSVKALPVDNSIDMYVAAQLYYSTDLTINGEADLVTSTDFWKLYKIPAGSLGSTLSVSGQTANTPVLVYSSGGLKAYSAFTSDDDGNIEVVDAAYSVSVVGTSYSLVVRLENGNAVYDSKDGLRSFGTPSTIKLGSFVNRPVCQFNFAFDATCTSIGASVVTLVTADNRRSVSFPAYCANFTYASNIYNNLHAETVEITHLETGQSFSSDFTCGTDIAHEKYGGRSYVIIAENSQDQTNPEKSSADNVFRNKNSIFYQLSEFVNDNNYITQPRYENFFAVLHNGPNYNKTQDTNYEKFLTKVMAATSGSPPPLSIDVPVSIRALLEDTIQSVNTYSDMFLVINYNVSVTDDDVVAIQSALAVQRSKLYILFVQTYTFYPNDVYYQLNQLAISSGGITVRLNSYADLNTFFVQYYPVLVANDIVAKAYSENQRPGIALSNVNLLPTIYYLLLTNEDLLGDGIVNATVTVSGEIAVSQLNSIGELQLFKLTVSVAGVYNIPILFSTAGLAQFSNAILLANTGSQDFISLSFIDKDGRNRNDVVFNEGGVIPVFYSSSPFDPNSNISITYSDATNPAKPVYSGKITDVDGCEAFKSYKWTTDYSWTCTVSGGLYHFKIDRAAGNTTISRTFPIRCLGSNSGDCLNGGTKRADGGCVCTLEYTGNKCESPRCLNGGTLTSAGTCDCSPAFHGTFCEEAYSPCYNSPSTPDYRADLSSLVFVVDVNALAVGGMTADFGVTGIPITVVLYGDGNAPRIVQSTTNSAHLLEVLGPITLTTLSTTASSAPPNSDMYNATNLAIDNQITNRALVIVYTSNADVPIDSDLLVRLAAKRVELRVLSTSGAESQNAKTLSLVGNGIPLAIEKSGDFQNYLTTYVGPLFQSLQYQANIPQMVFNVFQTGQLTDITTTITIPKDSTFDNVKSTIFVHTYKGNVDGTTPSFIGDTQIYKISNYDPREGQNIVLKQNVSNVNGYYAIEIIGYLKTAYLFNKNNTNGANEIVNSGVEYAESNVMHIYSAPFSEVATSNPANFPYLSIKEILNNGSLSDATTVLFTIKSNTSCFFSHFTTLDVCSQSSTIGYQVQLTTRSSANEKRQQQFSLTCFKSTYKNSITTCRGHGSPKADCFCDDNWRGIDCTEPVCANGGVRDMSVCRCPVDTYGLRCELTFGTAPTTLSQAISTSTPIPSTSYTSSISTIITSESTTVITVPTTHSATQTTTAPTEIRAAAFIIDLIGTDDYAYNNTIQSIVTYFKAFGNIHYIMLVGNLNGNLNESFAFQQYDDETYLFNRTLLFWPLRSIPSRTSNVTSALTTIRDAYDAIGTKFNNAVSLNIFYLSQIGFAANDDPTVNMGGLELFNKSAVAYSSFSKSVDPTVLDSLKKFSNDVSGARDYYSGLTALVASTAENTKAILPEKPAPLSCVYGLQSNIRVAIDRALPSSEAVTTSLNTFLTNFRPGFNNINNDVDRCSSNPLPAFYNEKSTLTAFPYYDTYFTASTFCPSQYTSMISFPNTGALNQTVFSDKLVKLIGKNINSAECACNRFSDSKTIKFVVWLPRTPQPVQQTWMNLLKLNTTNAYHFVVPFYDVTEESKATDLYYQLLVAQDAVKGGDYYLLPNAATAADIQTDVIDKLYEKLCETAGVDPTAVPPSWFKSYIENRQKDYYY
uniref:EGF-like domain-containing protein n=1 Tax=Caenorhabditis tropicalis TaxID=1561998 RepID=A0A1I7SZF9_9PELO